MAAIILGVRFKGVISLVAVIKVYAGIPVSFYVCLLFYEIVCDNVWFAPLKMNEEATCDKHAVT